MENTTWLWDYYEHSIMVYLYKIKVVLNAIFYGFCKYIWRVFLRSVSRLLTGRKPKLWTMRSLTIWVLLPYHHLWNNIMKFKILLDTKTQNIRRDFLKKSYITNFFSVDYKNWGLWEVRKTDCQNENKTLGVNWKQT